MSVMDKIKTLGSYIMPDKNYNPDNKDKTVGWGMRTISAIKAFSEKIVIGMEGDGTSAKEMEIEDNITELIEFAKKLAPVADKNPNAAMTDVLSPNEIEQFKNLSKDITFALVDNTQTPKFKQFLQNQGIAFSEVAHAVENFSIIIGSSDDAAKFTQARRVLAIDQKYGLVDLADFNAHNDAAIKIQMTNIDGWEAQLYNNLMQEARIPGGIAYANTDINNLKCNITYRQEDHAMMQVIALEAELIKTASLNAKSNLLLKNKLQGQLKDKLLLANAMEMSQFTNFYICSESVDKYITLDKNGCTLYSGGKKIETVNRDDLSEAEFKKHFEKLASHIQNNNMVILQDKDMLPNRDEALKKLQKQSTRKELMSKMHSNIFSYDTSDKETMKELENLKNKSTSDLIKITKERFDTQDKAQPTASLFILKLFKDYVVQNNGILPDFNIQDMLTNMEGKPCVDMLIQSIQDYAVAYAKNEQLNNWLKAATEINKQVEYTSEEIQQIQEDINKAQRDFKDTIEAFKNTYNLPDELVNNITQGLAANCGATIDPATKKIEFSNDMEKVNLMVAQLNKTRVDLDKVAGNLEKNVGREQVSIGSQLSDRSHANERAMVEEERKEAGAIR